MLGIRSKLMRLLLAGPAARQHEKTLESLRESGKTPQTILFLCYGNICRSPVAEKLAQRLLASTLVTSAGFYPQERRATPENVQRAAQTIGVDLANWSSRRVNHDMVSRAELVVLLDLKNFRDFRREFPAELGKIALLGLFLEPPQINIMDPYGLPEKETLEIVRLIEAAVQKLARKIAR